VPNTRTRQPGRSLPSLSTSAPCVAGGPVAPAAASLRRPLASGASGPARARVLRRARGPARARVLRRASGARSFLDPNVAPGSLWPQRCNDGHGGATRGSLPRRGELSARPPASLSPQGRGWARARRRPRPTSTAARRPPRSRRSPPSALQQRVTIPRASRSRSRSRSWSRSRSR
jgi:hypothetical protein